MGRWLAPSGGCGKVACPFRLVTLGGRWSRGGGHAPQSDRRLSRIDELLGGETSKPSSKASDAQAPQTPAVEDVEPWGDCAGQLYCLPFPHPTFHRPPGGSIVKLESLKV